jgi:hypothetical protein
LKFLRNISSGKLCVTAKPRRAKHDKPTPDVAPQGDKGLPWGNMPETKVILIKEIWRIARYIVTADYLRIDYLLRCFGGRTGKFYERVAPGNKMAGFGGRDTIGL